MRELILIQISGEDRPGVMAAMSRVLATYEVEILDIGQSVIHDTLNMGVLIRIPAQAESAPILKDLLFTAHELEINLKFTPITHERYERWVGHQGRQRQIVTLLGRRIGSRALHGVAQALSDNGLNIEVVTRLSGRAPLDEVAQQGPNSCVEFWVRGQSRDQQALRKSFLETAAAHSVDIAIQEDNIFRRNRRLIAFDMDSTLIRVEVIDELARLKGVGEACAAITEAAMRGEMDFNESLKQRLKLLEGLSEEALRQVADTLPLSDGAARLIHNLKRFGYKIAIISGGFTYFGKRLQERFGIDYLHANELEIKDGRVTGRVIGEIVNAAKKAEFLKAIAEAEGIDLQQVIAVGDGANDLPMLNLAGLGIAFHAKPKVKEGAGHAISTFGLDSVLYLMGMRDQDIVDEEDAGGAE